MVNTKTIKQIDTILELLFKTNKYLADNGKTPLAVELLGEPGMGKTTACKQIADRHGMDFVKLTLSQYDDLGDFVGFPIRSFEMEKNGEKQFVHEEALTLYTKDGWKFTGLKRTENCPPQWLVGHNKPMVVLIDDWTRAQPRFQQAMMEFIECQTYGDYSLPKGSTILLTSNPDNGDNQVNSIDPAMRTRFGSINVGFDVKEWAEWAEFNDIDPRCINFFLMNPEIYNPFAEVGDTEEKKVNPRSLTKFFLSLSLIEDFNTIEARDLIANYGHIFVNETIAGLFLQFITDNLDKLITPQEMLDGDYKAVVERLKSDMSPKGDFLASIASVIAVRLENYIKKCAKEKSIKPTWAKSLGELLKTDKLFPKDIRLDIAKSVFSSAKEGKEFMSWATDADLRKMITMR